MSDEPVPTETHLWTVLRVYLSQVCALFGAPADIARGLFLTPAQHQHLCAWLLPLEALLRRLLYLLSRTLKPTPARETKARAPRGVKAGFGAAFEVERSETWRVSFDVLPHPRRKPWAAPPSTQQHAAAPKPESFAAAPLALRLEALLRIAENPLPYANRLAARLAGAREDAADALLTPPRSAGPLYAPAYQASALIFTAQLAPASPDSS